MRGEETEMGGVGKERKGLHHKNLLKLLALHFSHPTAPRLSPPPGRRVRQR